ncbi:MAG TPA: hypothetical protein VGF95_05445 [Solirubrobacteraceae bacterium]|jgi:hypothetical protein
MSVWVLLLLLGVIKIPLAGLMIWMPFRSDPAIIDDDDDGVDDQPSDDGGDGGSKRPHSPRPGPHPRSPLRNRRRRGAHGQPTSPLRVRFPLVAPRRRVLSR